MNSSFFSTGELPPRKYDNVAMRNGAISSGHATAGEWHQRNYRDEFHGNEMACLPGRFHDMLPDMRESEASLCGAGHVQRGSVHLACSCSGCQQPEHFYDDDHDHHQSSSRKRYRHGITGSSTPTSDQTGHPYDLCDRGCCGSVAMPRERSGVANCMVERTRARSRSSLSVDSHEFQRNAAAVGGMPNFPLARREVETRSFSMHKGFMADSPAQTRAPLKQIILYGWYLMKAPREGHAADPSTLFSVAIGGYRNPRMEAQDFFETATVVERLERWKLRTRDGLEVGLMGMINIEKSVASGFSPSLVQCFMIGFPSAWVYMLLNMQKCVPKSSFPGMPSPSASPASSAGRPGVTANTIRDCLGTPITPEADLVQSILQSPLFTAGPDVKTRTAILGGCSTPATTPIVETWDSRKRPRSELHSPVADIPLVDPAVAPADSFHSDHQVGASPDVTEEKADAELDEELEIEDSITVATTPTIPIVETRDSRKRPRSELHSPVADIPLVDPVVAPHDSFYSDRQVEPSPDVTKEKVIAELDEELENEDSITHKDDMDVEVDQSCKVNVESRARARRKRYKISRNYYQRGKKKSSTKRNDEKVPPRSDKSTTTVKTPIESTEVENDESQVVEEMIQPPTKKVDRPTRSTKSSPKSSSSLEGPESSVDNSHLKTSRQTKNSVVHPLPSPKVADKSKVTEAFGLKKSLHGRVLVPPLATWRSQSIKYDMDGGIIAISDGFTASDDENCTGYYNFKPPADKGARRMQKRLCKAADTGSRKK